MSQQRGKMRKRDSDNSTIESFVMCLDLEEPRDESVPDCDSKSQNDLESIESGHKQSDSTVDEHTNDLSSEVQAQKYDRIKKNTSKEDHQLVIGEKNASFEREIAEIGGITEHYESRIDQATRQLIDSLSDMAEDLRSQLVDKHRAFQVGIEDKKRKFHDDTVGALQKLHQRQITTRDIHSLTDRLKEQAQVLKADEEANTKLEHGLLVSYQEDVIEKVKEAFDKALEDHASRQHRHFIWIKTRFAERLAVHREAAKREVEDTLMLDRAILREMKRDLQETKNREFTALQLREKQERDELVQREKELSAKLRMAQEAWEAAEVALKKAKTELEHYEAGLPDFIASGNREDFEDDDSPRGITIPTTRNTTNSPTLLDITVHKSFIKMLRGHIVRMEQELFDVTSDRDSLQHRVTLLEGIVPSLRNELQKLEAMLTDSQNELMSAQKASQEILEEREDLVMEIKTLRGALKKTKTDLKLRESKDRELERLKFKEKECEVLRAQLEKLRSSMGDSDEKIIWYKELLEAANQKITVLEGQLLEKMGVEEEAQALQKIMNDLIAEIADLRQELDEKGGKIYNLETALDFEKEHIKTLKNQIKDLEVRAARAPSAAQSNRSSVDFGFDREEMMLEVTSKSHPHHHGPDTFGSSIGTSSSQKSPHSSEIKTAEELEEEVIARKRAEEIRAKFAGGGRRRAPRKQNTMDQSVGSNVSGESLINQDLALDGSMDDSRGGKKVDENHADGGAHSPKSVRSLQSMSGGSHFLNARDTDSALSTESPERPRPPAVAPPPPPLTNEQLSVAELEMELSHGKSTSRSDGRGRLAAKKKPSLGSSVDSSVSKSESTIDLQRLQMRGDELRQRALQTREARMSLISERVGSVMMGEQAEKIIAYMKKKQDEFMEQMGAMSLTLQEKDMLLGELTKKVKALKSENNDLREQINYPHRGLKRYGSNTVSTPQLPAMVKTAPAQYERAQTAMPESRSSPAMENIRSQMKQNFVEEKKPICIKKSIDKKKGGVRLRTPPIHLKPTPLSL